MAITKSTPAPLTGGTLWCVTIALSLATFMQMLDSTISNVAIPTISGFLGASTDEGTSGYHLVWCSKCHCDPCYWQVGTKNRRIKIIFTFSHFFSLSSLMCSLSTNLDVLIFLESFRG